MSIFKSICAQLALSAVIVSNCLGAATAQVQKPGSYAVAVADMAMQTLWKTPPHPQNRTCDQATVLLGIEGLWYRTGEKKYFDYMQKSMDRLIRDDGSIDAYDKEQYNIGDIACGRMLLALHKVTGKEKYFKAAEQLRQQLLTQPRTAEGSFGRTKIYPLQAWLNDLYMALPFYAEWALTFQEGDTSFNDIAAQFVNIENHTRDSKTGLMYNAWDDKATGQAPNVSARAMGCYGAALIDVLEYFPKNNARRKELTDVLNRYAAAIKQAQDPATGLWWDEMNVPYPAGQKENYFESSSAALLVYTLTKGVRLGVLDVSYLDVAKKGYNAIVDSFVQLQNDGLYHYAGGSKQPYGKNDSSVPQDDAKCVGAFIQAANEQELIPQLKKGKGKTILLDSYYNNEHTKNPYGKWYPSHYKWDERSNGGYQFWAKNFEYNGAAVATAYQAPTAAMLKNAGAYIVTDPDITKENADAKFMTEAEANTIVNWVKAGGKLILMLNDSGNCDLSRINILCGKMGFTFNNDSRNHVMGHEYEQGALDIDDDNAVFKTARHVYIKEISTIKITDRKKATALYTDKGDVLMITAKIGKGAVFAVGDPWLYNEYVDGRKLPDTFNNFEAMNDLTQWILR
ncbi:MAG: glycoside hydrolase family 88 protein [Edaphocola sp.]